MKPYYDHGGITIYHADNREVVLPPMTVDLVITSPPYNVGISPGGNGKGFYTPSRGGRDRTKWAGFDGYGQHNDAMPMDEYTEWQKATLRSLWGVLADDGAIFYNHKPRIVFKELWLPLTLNPGLPLHQIITWSDGAGFGLGDSHFCPTFEWLMVFSKPAFRLISRSASAMGDFWQIPSESDKHGHPCPFPVELAARVIRATKPALTLDPFAGVGSTLIAAKQNGRHAIGIELDERYCEIAAKRLQQEMLPMASDPSEYLVQARLEG